MNNKNEELKIKLYSFIDDFILSLYKTSGISPENTIEEKIKVTKYVFWLSSTILSGERTPEKIELLDYIFDKIDINKLSKDYNLSLLNNTYKSREKMKSWYEKKDLIAKKLENEGVNIKKEMKGLL
jgi:hypothetical protein